MKDKPTPLGKVQDLINRLHNREPPVIYSQAKVSQIVEAFAQAPHSRIVYVVGNDKKLQGIITLGRVVRHVLVHYHDSSLDPRSVFNLALAEQAGDFMQPESIRIRLDDDLDAVLGEMIEHDVAELPVVDAEGRMLQDITMVDIIDYYRKVRGSHYLNNHNGNHAL